jgi:toxin ParE1/3/4
MNWEVTYTLDAEQDLQDIHRYISEVLLEPVIAQRQTTRIMDAIDSLNDMPLRHQQYDHEPWRTKGLRFLPVDNYLVFYLPDELRGVVAIIRIMYGGRDVNRQLNTPSQ